MSRQVSHASSPLAQVWLAQAWLARVRRCVSAALRAALVSALFCGLFCLPSAKAADAGPALQEAAAALQRGDFAGAELKLRAELQVHPDDAETLSLLGFALDVQKKFPEADSVHRRAVAAAPGSTRVLGRYANHLLSTGDEKSARKAFQDAIAIDPSDRYANLQLAQLALKAKDAAHAKEALLYLDHLPADQREAPEAAVQRLAALDLSGDREAAEALFVRLSSATQQDARLSASMGWTLTEAGQFDHAETFLTHALAADPSNFQVLYDLGVVACYARHYERARDVLETAVRQQPNNVDVLYSLAFVYSALRQPEPTLRLLARAAKLAPRRADVQRLVAVTTGDLQANEDSAEAWDRYAALAPKDDTARRERGFARIHLRQFETGIADLEWYIARHPDDAMGHYELGLAQSTSDPTKGLASLDRALELKPDFVAARAARGALYYVQGKLEAAVPDLESAVASEPSNGVILDRLGQTYRALDRLADAIRVLRKAAVLAPGESTIQLHLANALAEAGENAESEILMDRYRQRRPTQAPRDLMRYLSLTPEQQRADYRVRVEKAVHDNPGDANAQLHYLKLSLEESQIDQASATARAIGGMKPGAAVLADAGRALLTARQYAPARELLEQAAAADPSAGLELDLAIAAFHTTGGASPNAGAAAGNSGAAPPNSGAVAGLRLLERVPESRRNADYYLARAQMLDASGKAADAMAALERAIHAAPGRAELYWQGAVFLNRNGHAPEALQLLDRAEQILPQDPQIPLLRATVLESAGQAEDADHLLDKIQRRWPERSAVWVARGIFLAAQRHFEEARRALETAVSLGARSPEAWFYLADTTVRSAPDRIGDAEAAVGEALKLAPEDPWTQTLAGQIAYKKGDYKTAAERQQNAIRLRPGWIGAHQDLAQSYTALGRKQEAQAQQEIAQAIRKESPDKGAEAPDPGKLFRTRPPQDW
ncbi:MAG TPA: tetratricopeptide repeat protein [Candidatus Acidoferrales bacterium]|nr:tetratricopeptide repeat protein [Candidatus Acidoferrales bacterium]